MTRAERCVARTDAVARHDPLDVGAGLRIGRNAPVAIDGPLAGIVGGQGEFGAAVESIQSMGYDFQIMGPSPIANRFEPIVVDPQADLKDNATWIAHEDQLHAAASSGIIAS